MEVCQKSEDWRNVHAFLERLFVWYSVDGLELVSSYPGVFSCFFHSLFMQMPE
jgi:hypothetical protein